MPAGLSGANRIAAIAARPPASDHTIVDIRLMLMPASRAASAFAAEARIAVPYLVRLEEQAEREHRDTGITTITVSSWLAHEDAADLPRRARERGRVGPHRADVGQHELEEQQDLRDADQRDEQDHPRRGEQPPHDDELDRGADDGTDHDARDERQPERRVPVDDEPVEQRAREAAHLADREVDDPGRAEDEDRRRPPSRRT